VEREKLGGTCLNWGCIPTKTLHGLAHLVERGAAASAAGAGGAIVPEPEALFEHKDGVVDELVSGVDRILRARKVEVVRGSGRITAPGVVEVEGKGSAKARAVIIATGSADMDLPGVTIDGKRILGSRDLLDIGGIPETMLIIGGGVIGCEFASIFNALGCSVTVVEMLPSLIATEDAQVGRYLQTYFRKKGITTHLGTKVERLESSDAGVTASLEGGARVSAEVVLVAVGRRPVTEGIGLEAAGIDVTRTGITVNGRMETSTRGFYAAGDVVGGLLLAHVATREGIVAAGNALGDSREIDYSAVPSTIYTLPEISRVGITENEAKERSIEVLIGRFPFAANGKAKGLGEEEGFVKWVAAKDGGRLLGLHIIGPQATELVAAGILAVQRGMTIEEFSSAIFPHPTLSEALAEAAEAAVGRAIHLVK
jgi:dihydrolipoamide dehydrogenase